MGRAVTRLSGSRAFQPPQGSQSACGGLWVRARLHRMCPRHTGRGVCSLPASSSPLPCVPALPHLFGLHSLWSCSQCPQRVAGPAVGVADLQQVSHRCSCINQTAQLSLGGGSGLLKRPETDGTPLCRWHSVHTVVQVKPAV